MPTLLGLRKKPKEPKPSAELPAEKRSKQLEAWTIYDKTCLVVERARDEKIELARRERENRRKARQERKEEKINNNELKKLRNEDRSIRRDNSELTEEVRACISDDSDLEEVLTEPDIEVDIEEEVEKKKRLYFHNDAIFLASCSVCDTEEVERLLEAGHNINTVNADGLTALHTAAIDGNYKIAEYLIKRGINVNQKDNEGWTALHAAAGTGNLRIANFLVGKGALVDHINCDGCMPTDLTEDMACKMLLDGALIRRGIRNEKDKVTARRKEELVLMEDVLKLKEARISENEELAQNDFLKNLEGENGGNTHVTRFQDSEPNPKTGATKLHIAAAKGYIDILKILIDDVRMDLEQVDDDVWTPLHAACHWEQSEAIDILVANGASLCARNRFGQCPMDVMSTECKKYKDLVSMTMTAKKLEIEAEKQRERDDINRKIAEANQAAIDARNEAEAKLEAMRGDEESESGSSSDSDDSGNSEESTTSEDEEDEKSLKSREKMVKKGGSGIREIEEIETLRSFHPNEVKIPTLVPKMDLTKDFEEQQKVEQKANFEKNSFENRNRVQGVEALIPESAKSGTEKKFGDSQEKGIKVPTFGMRTGVRTVPKTSPPKVRKVVEESKTEVKFGSKFGSGIATKTELKTESKTESKFEPQIESAAKKPTFDQKSPYGQTTDSGLSSYGQKTEDRRPSFGQSLISKPVQKPSFDQKIAASNPKSTLEQQKPTFNPAPVSSSSPPKPAKRTESKSKIPKDEHKISFLTTEQEPRLPPKDKENAKSVASSTRRALRLKIDSNKENAETELLRTKSKLPKVPQTPLGNAFLDRLQARKDNAAAIKLVDKKAERPPSVANLRAMFGSTANSCKTSLKPSAHAESETNRMARSRRERKTRRSTQGIMLSDLQQAKELYLDVPKNSTPDEDSSNSSPIDSIATSSTTIAPTNTSTSGIGSSLKSSAPSTATTTPVPPQPSGYIPPMQRQDSNTSTGPNTTATPTCPPTFTTTTTLPVTGNDTTATPTVESSETNNSSNLSAQELAFQKSRQRRGNRNANRQRIGGNLDGGTATVASGAQPTSQTNPPYGTNDANSKIPPPGVSPTNSDFGTQTDKNVVASAASFSRAEVDYKIMYERERQKKERLEGELSDVTEMLNKTLSCITDEPSISSTNNSSCTSVCDSTSDLRDACRTIDNEISQRNGEVERLRQENSSLVRVISKMRPR